MMEVTVSKSTKALMEILVAVNDLVKSGQLILADGKITLSDLQYAMNVFGSLKTVVEDFKEAKLEVLDMDKAEAQAVISGLVDVLFNVYEAFVPKV